MACGDKHPAKGLAKKMNEKKMEGKNPKAPVPLAKKMQEKKEKK